MVFHSFLRKSNFLLFLVSILVSLVAISTPVESHDSSDSSESYPHGNCKPCAPTCKKIYVRKEWYTLSDKEKLDYINAVKCLTRKPTLPAINKKFPGTRTRYDDFVAVHCSQTLNIHFVGFFLQWHRYMVAVYEKALREECGYKGSQPYWNIANDIKSGRNINKWGIFDNKTGFGGNGPYDPNPPGPNQFNVTGNGGGCVPEGAFGACSDYKVHFDLTLTGDVLNKSHPQCLRRSFAWPNITAASQVYVDKVQSQLNFTFLNQQLDPLPGTAPPSVHASIHAGIGGGAGPMSNAFVSPSDPLFYMHHTNLDRIYWQWEMLNPGKRFCEVGGSTIPFDYTPSKGPPVTPDFQVNMDAMGPSIPVKNLLNTFVEPWCYKYDCTL